MLLPLKRHEASLYSALVILSHQSHTRPSRSLPTTDTCCCPLLARIGDESASIINEMLVQMDGFEDNRGIVVLGATNRPGAIDSALIRPGRFDRIIYMPLPDATGRAKILQVGWGLDGAVVGWTGLRLA